MAAFAVSTVALQLLVIVRSAALPPVAEAVITKYMQKYHPEMYLQNLEKDKTIKDSWIKSLRANAVPKPVAAPATEGNE